MSRQTPRKRGKMPNAGRCSLPALVVNWIGADVSLLTDELPERDTPRTLCRESREHLTARESPFAERKSLLLLKKAS
jgi:hypothetical protein